MYKYPRTILSLAGHSLFSLAFSSSSCFLFFQTERERGEEENQRNWPPLTELLPYIFLSQKLCFLESSQEYLLFSYAEILPNLKTSSVFRLKTLQFQRSGGRILQSRASSLKNKRSLKQGEMIRMRTKTSTKSMSESSDSGSIGSEQVEWELRPGGMLVQKRDPDSDGDRAASIIKLRVKYGSSLHEIHISPQATFGDLKKLLSAQTGLHPQEQKLLFKGKERDSKAYLDISGVKDRSKIVLIEDPINRERRYLEIRKNAKVERASKSICEVSLEVDKLASQVSALESVISKGGKVAENDVLNLIELLMTQLIKLDGVIADGDVKLQRKMQVRRVQKYVETLDLLKIKNSTPSLHHHRGVPQPDTAAAPVVVTTKWETFDSAPAPSSLTTTTAATPKLLDWEFFE